MPGTTRNKQPETIDFENLSNGKDDRNGSGLNFYAAPEDDIESHKITETELSDDDD